MDQQNCPTPALTLDGKVVVPIDEYGNPVIPKDRHSKPLIYFSTDGIPMSLEDYKQWKLYLKEQNRTYQQQQQVQKQLGPPQHINSLFHAHTASVCFKF